MRTTSKIFALLAFANFIGACGSKDEGSELASSRRSRSSVSVSQGQEATACSFVVNHQSYSGKTVAECEKLKKDLAISIPSTIPTPTAPVVVKPTDTVVSSNTSASSCQFSVNGTKYEGRTQAECDKLIKDLGIKFSL